MKQKIRNGILPLFTLLILMIVEGINVLGMISPSQWNKFEIMSNVFMLIIVVIGFFWIGLPNKKVGERNVGNILSNVAGSGIAFWMDVVIFGHTIQLERLFDSLWGWSSWWIVMAFIQILFLSELGKTILDGVSAFLAWLKSVCKSAGELLKSIWHGILNIICNSKNKFIITFIGVLFWGVCIVAQIYNEGVATVFSETNIVRRNVLPWIAYFVICIIFYISKNVIEVIVILNPKYLLAVAIVIVTIVVFAVIVHVLPSTLVIIAIIMLIPFVFMFFIALVIRIIDRIRNGTKSSDLNLKDLITVIIALVGIPLIVICSVVGEQFYSGQYAIAEDDNTLSTLLRIIDIAGSVAKELLELFL